MAFCKNCGNKLEDGTKFCPKCGNPTGGTWSNENVTGNDTVWNIAFTAPIDEKIKLEIIKVLMNDLGMDKSYYNPQNEMLAFCKTKCSIRKTKRIFLRVPSYTKL